jgi:hypothetical protein
MIPVQRPEMICPICGEKCAGGIALHKHQATFHSDEEIQAHRKDTDAAEFEANHNDVREQEKLDNFIEFGG